MQSSMAQFQPSFSFLPVDPNMELMNQYFTELNAMGIPNLNFQSFMDFSNSDSLTQQQLPEFPENSAEIFSGIFHHDDKNALPVAEPVVSSGNEFHESSQKKKAMDVPESSCGNSSPPVSEEGIKRKNISRRRKRMRGSESEEKKPKEVVHVRARRGQATDSHSLAERVRRGKINERLRCLQDIVPGCCKTLGMAGILDEIINYVQSLQNQVEFLSMKLVAASTSYNFNLQMDATEEAMQRAKACEGQKVQRLTVTEGYQGLIASAQLGPTDLTCGNYFSLPYNP